MKVLFLDVDGVLNHRMSTSILAIENPALRLLRYVLNQTNARIVMSSTWRKDPDTRAVFFRKTGIWPYSYTPIDPTGKRGLEIRRWLREHPEVTRYAIVDDGSDMLPEQLPFFVQTSFETGLLNEHAEKLVEILRG